MFLVRDLTNRQHDETHPESTPPTSADEADSSQLSPAESLPSSALPANPGSEIHLHSQQQQTSPRLNNQIGTVFLYGTPIVSLVMDNKDRLCLAQISSTLLKDYSYNEIHNRRVALGITCAQCTPVQLELLRRAGAMPVTSRRCGMITRREAERLCKSFLGDQSPPKLPENFAFDVSHGCAWGCRGAFLPSRYNSSRAKCIKCFLCSLFFSPNKFIFHSHRLPDSKYVQPDAANFNSWRRHIHLTGAPPDDVAFAWEDVKAMFNGGSRKRSSVASAPVALASATPESSLRTPQSQLPPPPPPPPLVPVAAKSRSPQKKSKSDQQLPGSESSPTPLVNPLLYRLNAAAAAAKAALANSVTLTSSTNAASCEAQVSDYQQLWSSGRLWAPYLNLASPLPVLPPYLCASYSYPMMKPTPEMPWPYRHLPHRVGVGGTGVQLPAVVPMTATACLDEDSETFVDVESTEL